MLTPISLASSLMGVCSLHCPPNHLLCEDSPEFLGGGGGSLHLIYPLARARTSLVECLLLLPLPQHPRFLQLLRKHRWSEPCPHRGMKCAGTPQKVPDGMELEWGSAPRGRQDHSQLPRRRGLDSEDRGGEGHGRQQG